MKEETIGIIEILIASVLFGFIPIIVKFGSNLGAYNLTFFRILVATICVYLFILFSKNLKLAPFKQDKWKLLLFGFIHGLIIVGYFISIQYLSVASAVLLLYSSSIWIVVFSHFILKEKITKLTIIALIVAFIGVILVASPQNFFVKESLIGSLAGLIAGIFFGLVYVLSKTFKSYDKVSLTFWQNLIALPFVTILLFFDPPKHLASNDILIVLLLGSVFTALPFVLVFKGLGKVSGQKAGVITLLDMIFPILFAFLIFKEVPTIAVVIGGVLIIIGTYLVTRADVKQVKEAKSE